MSLMRGNPEYHHLIDFVRPSSSSSRDRLLKNIPETQSASSLTGIEARSFYEQLCSETRSGTDEGHYFSVKGVDKDRKTSGNQDIKCEKNENHQQKNHKCTFCEYEPVDKKHISGMDCFMKRESNQHTLTKTENQNTEFDSFDQIQSKQKTLGKVILYDSTRLNFNAKVKEHKKGKTSVDVSQRVREYRKAELFRLAQNGDKDGVKSVLQQGVDVNAIDSFGWTAAMSAAFEGHITVLRALAKAGADLLIQNPQGYTAQSLAAQKRHFGVLEFIESFHKQGIVSTKKQDQQQIAKFYCAVCKGEFSYTDPAAHNRSVVHIFNVGRKPKDDSFLIPTSNLGYRLMLKLGWDGDRGLGPSGHGQKFPVKTLLKRDRKGLGNKITDKARVTHFSARDKLAVAHLPLKKRQENARTLSRRAQRAKERKDRQKEIDLRQQLS